jgi:hypothetical protein
VPLDTVSDEDIQPPVDKRWLIVPDNVWKVRWDLWIVLVLLFVAVTLPYRVAFFDKDDKIWTTINWIVQSSFGIDMLLTFFTIIHDPLTGSLIHCRKQIAL